ncbi:hypothetical protein TrVGV298_004645 [Trichoderma virens]|nr:hypothetical protein TrVGV298_004645 [Trichoderma virens]
MDSINKLAFRDGAPDPMLGDETYVEQDQACQVDEADITARQPIGITTHGAQEWEGGSTTIDPSRLLLSMDHTPLGVGELTGLSVDTDGYPVSSQIVRSQKET